MRRSIYEVHLGSWRRHTDNNFWLSYRELADQLVPYAKWMGFTHLELLPVNEHPFDGSWATSRPASTRRHAASAPVKISAISSMPPTPQALTILDWVPGHFPADDFALASLMAPRCMNTAIRAKVITGTGILLSITMAAAKSAITGG